MCRAAARLSRAVGICRESGRGAPGCQRKRPRPLRPGPVSPLLPPRKTMRSNPMLGGRPETWSAASVPQSVKAAVSPIWLQEACQLVDAGVEIGVARAYTPETPQCRCRVAPGEPRMASWPQSRNRVGSMLAVVACLAAIAAAGCAARALRPCSPRRLPWSASSRSAAITWDLNKDGNVTCEEWKQYVSGLFRDADTNRDGILTREEYAQLTRRDKLFETVGMNYFDANARRAPEPQRDGRQAQSRLCAARQERRLRDRVRRAACSP